MLKISSLLLVATVLAFASPLLEDRGTCGGDNLLRCFDPTGTASRDIANRLAATAFCCSYLSISVVTSTVDTTTPASTVTSTITVTDGTVTLTSLSTSVLVRSTTTVVATVTNTVAPQPPGKRDAAVIVASSSCLHKEYAAAALFSMLLPEHAPSTTSVTATAPTSTGVPCPLSTRPPRPQSKLPPPPLRPPLPVLPLPPSAPRGRSPRPMAGCSKPSAMQYAAVAANGFYPIVSFNGEVPDLASCINQCLTTYVSGGCIAVNYRPAYYYFPISNAYYNTARSSASSLARSTISPRWTPSTSSPRWGYPICYRRAEWVLGMGRATVNREGPYTSAWLH